MGIFTRRATQSQGYGNNSQQGSGPLLADGNDNTFITLQNGYYGMAPGAYLAYYPNMVSTDIPSGRKVVAVRIVHRIGQNNINQGIPEAYLRLNESRLENSRLYLNDGYQANVWRNQYGPWVYKQNNQAWSLSDVNAMNSEGSYVASNYQFPNARISEVNHDVMYDEPVAIPSDIYPASGSTVTSSSVSFSAVAPAPQEGQLVRIIVQVARNSGFSSDFRQFVGGFHSRTGSTDRATYVSNYADASFTDLGPGLWYMRVYTQDILGTVGTASATSQFTVSLGALPTPVNTAPPPAAISTTPYGIRTARIDTAASDNRAVGMEWQYSKSSTFASGVVTWKNQLAGLRGAGSVSYDALPKTGVPPGVYDYNLSADDPSQYLTQGAWFYRSRVIDRYGSTGPWSAISDTFTVAHAPLAQNVSPTSNAVIDQNVTPVRWTFGDPWTGDAQTAYQIRVYNDQSVKIYDSGKISSTSLQAFLTISATYLYSALRYTINVYDKDDVTSGSVATNNFIFSTSPAIVQSYPAQGEQVLTGQPTFVWSPGINRPGTTQRSYELKVYRQSDNVLIYTSNEVVSKATSHTPPQVILRNAISYRETLRIVDSDGLSSTLQRNFSASYQAPPEPSVTVDYQSYGVNGYVNINWSSTVPDDFFVAWKIYRQTVGTTQWVLIKTETDSAVSSFRDWLAPSAGRYRYSVTQQADRSGAVLESAINEAAEIGYVQSDDYWLIVERDNTQNVKLYSVVNDQFTDEIEMNKYVVKGRGSRVNYGTEIGMEGTLSVQLRWYSGMSARVARQVLRDLQYKAGSCLLRDPFGNITRVAIGTISTSRMAGVGVEEFADIEIPYSQVF